MRFGAAHLALPKLTPSQPLLLGFQTLLCFSSLGNAGTSNPESLAVWFPRVTVTHGIFL